jgi:carbon storage regulator
MLVLKRQVGEKLVIGNEVTVEVLSVGGDSVRLGIVAPRETSVHRFEVFSEIQAANHAASHTVAAMPREALTSLAARLRVPGEEAGDAPAADEGGTTPEVEGND